MCWAFYRFVDRELDLDSALGQLEVLAVAVATSGAALLIAANISTCSCTTVDTDTSSVPRAWARKSTPPTLVGRVSRGWAPKHLPAGAVEPLATRADAPATRS
ncbi:hypothetical protein [Cellulomonas hominis]|uniref:hypothetical protein n=1 Tax=Cellulomonas hominis TaxID=156981 RepID=UPI001BA42D14|nr:hypothetical protein [Cellulomonas hominis]VTR75415.1 hypothetical protein CHMI_00159 [Cellulomonas hominis]